MKKERFKIVHEDDDIVVVSKPAGLLSIPDRFGTGGESLQELLSRKRPGLMVVHRLDKGTSGLIIYAKNEKAHQYLNQQFEDRKVDKTYWVMVHGQMAESEGTIDKPISPDRSIAGKMMVNPKGKKAVSHFKVVERFRHHTLLHVAIETGRTHQIRVHMAFLEHPLTVDPLYGKEAAFYVSSIKRKYRLSKYGEELPLIERQTLHALKIGFKHPRDQKYMEVEADLPKDLSALLNQLRRWDQIPDEIA